jgi:hypothetical protein
LVGVTFGVRVLVGVGVDVKGLGLDVAVGVKPGHAVPLAVLVGVCEAVKVGVAVTLGVGVCVYLISINIV